MRPHLRDDGILTRADQQFHTPAEAAITRAMKAVEEAGASPALTDAVTLLSKARDRVADHVEGRYPVDEQACPGHVASERDPKECGLCGTHIDSLRPPDKDD